MTPSQQLSTTNAHSRVPILRPLVLAICAALLFVFWARAEIIIPSSNYVDPLKGHSLPSDRPSNRLRILFIGNSFTHYWGSIPSILNQFAVASNVSPPLTAEGCTEDGANLERHWNNQIAQSLIRQGNWDYVVLQDYSTAPLEGSDEMTFFTSQFDNQIRAAKAKTILFMTWPLQDSPQDLASISGAYLALGKSLHAPVVPIGQAFALVHQKDPSFNLYANDHKHPNSSGSYFNACIFYAYFYHRSPQGLPNSWTANANPDVSDGQTISIPPQDAAFLQSTAWQFISSSFPNPATQSAP